MASAKPRGQGRHDVEIFFSLGGCWPKRSAIEVPESQGGGGWCPVWAL